MTIMRCRRGSLLVVEKSLLKKGAVSLYLPDVGFGVHVEKKKLMKELKNIRL